MARICRIGVFTLFFGSGVCHFLWPDAFVHIMPSYLPWPRALVFVSGAFEIAGGVGILIPRFRKIAGYGLLALLVAVFPANIHMFTQEWMRPDFHVNLYAVLLLLRLPLQLVFMLAVLKAFKSP